MKQNKLKFLMLVVMIRCSLSGFSYSFMVDGIAYNINGSEATVTYTVYYSPTNYSGITGNLIIPSTVAYNGMTYSVTSIGESAFSQCSGLTSVTIPNSVTSIGEKAFWYCSNLTNFNLPNSILSIGNAAFCNCSGLSGDLIIPNSVSSISESSFSGCTSLTSVTIPNSVTSIGDNAFSACTKVSNVSIGNSVTRIGYGAFSGCTSLTSLAIPNSVTSIGDYAFSGCTGLTGSLTIPNRVISIGDYSFSECSGVTHVKIGNAVTSIGDGAFAHTRLSGELIIPNSVISIGDYAFLECDGLTSLIIGNSVTTVGDYAFWYCLCLESVTIGESVNYIGERAFYTGGYLRRLEYNAVNCSTMNWLFSYNDKLYFLKFGENVQHIPSGIPTIALSSRNLVLPNCVKYIESSAIEGVCNAVVIGDDIESIASGAFSNDISTAYVSSTIPRPCSSGAFPNPKILYVPKGCRGKYLTSDGWCEFEQIIEGSYIKVNSLSINNENITLCKGKTIKLEATIMPENATSKNIEWCSSNPTIITVSETGLVSAIDVGEGEIYALIDNEIAICHVTVTENTEVSDIQLNYSDLKLTWDNIVNLTATVLPSEVNQEVIWTVPENNVIYSRVVDNQLRVMAMRSGTVTVTATSVADPSVSADCVITIQIPDVNGDTSLDISDVTALIDYLLGGDPESINIGDADVNRDGFINISDVTTLIDKFLENNR